MIALVNRFMNGASIVLNTSRFMGRARATAMPAALWVRDFTRPTRGWGCVITSFFMGKPSTIAG